MITRVTAEAAAKWRPQLIELLEDSIQHGASIGFLLPLSHDEVTKYWDSVLPGLTTKNRVLLIAEEDGQLQGSVQLEIPWKANGSHRAEVQKLLVHSRARSRGLGRALMVAAEDAARKAGIELLVLDTRTADTAETLYKSMGFVLAGIIPDYARSTNGQLEACSFFYKKLA